MAVRLITLNFHGGPQDGSHEKVKSSLLTSGECIERRFPAHKSGLATRSGRSPKTSAKKAKEHLYQTQQPWVSADKQIILHYLGIVAVQ